MRIKEIEYTKLFNLGNYENETIKAVAELDSVDNTDECFQKLKAEVVKQNSHGQEKAKKVAAEAFAEGEAARQGKDGI